MTEPQIESLETVTKKIIDTQKINADKTLNSINKTLFYNGVQQFEINAIFNMLQYQLEINDITIDNELMEKFKTLPTQFTLEEQSILKAIINKGENK